MKKGDILIIHYKFDPFASLIRLATKSYWNHVAICIDSENIVEVRGRRVVVSSTKRYIHRERWYDCKVVSVRGLRPDNVKKVISYLIDVNEKGYFKWVKACFMAFFNSDKELPRRTCSGLIAEALASVDIYFIKGKDPSKITPADISRSTKTKRVSGRALYRRLQ